MTTPRAKHDSVPSCPANKVRVGHPSVDRRPEGTDKSAKRKVVSGSWARLLKRVFAIDVSRYPRCGADLEIIAAVLDPIQIARYLKHTGMPAAPPARAGVKIRLANDEWC